MLEFTDVGFWFLDFEFRTLDFGFRVLSFRSRTLDFGFRILVVRFWGVLLNAVVILGFGEIFIVL